MRLITAEDVAALYDAGPDAFLWGGADIVVTPAADYSPWPADIYLFRHYAAWFEQWNGDWEAAAAQLNERMIEQGLATPVQE